MKFLSPFPTGDPSEENCYADISAVYDYLIKEKKIPPSKIILYGRSLGSGPSCFLAAKSSDDGASVGGLILHAPFLSIYRVVIDSGCTLPGDKFPNLEFAPNIRYVYGFLPFDGKLRELYVN